ncbi:SGNH/GDSL hydrolase family protein [Xylanimonas ulmi]|uniref:Lysophospholipase L1-like esterase n=1 Tax=Xylanimonas ulmi TaxID=228973 RepID=A0A4Q7M616_9MICO|nr:SGNH/GDSL hydrolase family protein [Xylanibacterium ulmi]RZS62092.1 lysophospholipase L1-like esterase [Xylanibacterium ulmi]
MSEHAPTNAPTAHDDVPAPRWTRYIAVGDSFSEGLWDPYPTDPTTDDAPEAARSTERTTVRSTERSTERTTERTAASTTASTTASDGVTDGPDGDPGAVQRGWADRLADTLSARRVAAGLEPLEYANLAIRGRLLRPIVGEQVPIALDARPDLVSLVAGGNDILRPGVDVDDISQALEDAVVAIRASGADVLLGAGFKAGGALSFTRGRVGVYNANIWSIARRHGAYVLDLWGMRSLFDLRLWAEDRLHLTPEGHRRVMNAALEGLLLDPVDPDYDAPLAPAPPAPFVEKAKADAEWAREYVVPWVKRRITHTSSGDGRTPKWPAPVRWPVSRG